MTDEGRRQARVEREEAARRARQDWFARELGDEWEPDGTGVYRYVGDRPAGTEAEDQRVSRERLDEALLDAAAEPQPEQVDVGEPEFDPELEPERRGRWRRR